VSDVRERLGDFHEVLARNNEGLSHKDRVQK
jgi:hypothetical protein